MLSTEIPVVANTQRDEKRLECPDPTCRKRFNSCWSLTRNTRTHNGDKPFKCSVPGCGKVMWDKQSDTENLSYVTLLISYD